MGGQRVARCVSQIGDAEPDPGPGTTCPSGGAAPCERILPSVAAPDQTQRWMPLKRRPRSNTRSKSRSRAAAAGRLLGLRWAQGLSYAEIATKLHLAGKTGRALTSRNMQGGLRERISNLPVGG